MTNENYLVTKKKVSRATKTGYRKVFAAYLRFNNERVICFSKKLLDLLPVEKMHSINGRRVVFDGSINHAELVDGIRTPVLENIVIHNIA